MYLIKRKSCSSACSQSAATVGKESLVTDLPAHLKKASSLFFLLALTKPHQAGEA